MNSKKQKSISNELLQNLTFFHIQPTEPGCVDSCLEDADCADSLYCVENVCVGHCAEYTACGEHFICSVSG